MPLSEWIRLVPGDLDGDAVGLWQVIPALRMAFGLDDAEIERVTRQILAELMARGARPVVGVCPPDARWNEVTRYGDSASAIIDGVMAEWHAMGRDPDVEDVWFALPELFRHDPSGPAGEDLQ
jgi:hypothetical protein